MSRGNELLVDSVVRLADAILSVRWSLAHWLMKKSFGEPAARDFAELALFRTLYMRRQVLTELKRLPDRDVVKLMTALLPHRSRRRFLKQMKKERGPEVQRACYLPFLQELKDELEGSIPEVIAQYSSEQPIADRLYPELGCDLNTLCAEAWRVEKAFPMQILKSPREQKRLQSQLGYEPDNYAQQLTSIIWQLGNNPNSLGLGPPRRNDLIFEVVGQRPSEDITGHQLARAFVSLFKALGDEKKARALFEHLMARVLRHQFRLSRDRNVTLFSEIEERQKVSQDQAEAYSDEEPWEPEDTLSLRGYEDVDYRLEYEALRNRLPPKQKVALDVYLESFDTRESIETICARRQLSPVGVRNNFHAVKRKAAVGKI